jgi:hypothetical protein
MIHKSSFLSQLFYNKTCVYCLLNASYRHFMVGEYPQRMVNLMVEDRSTMLKLFESEVERKGGSAQMVVGDYPGNFSGGVISRTSFGSSFAQGKEKVRQFQMLMSKQNIPWVNLIWNSYYSNGKVPRASKEKGSFWWKDVLKLSVLFRGIASCKVEDGSTVLFWSDVWNDHLIQQKLPRFYSFAKNKNISVFAFLQNDSLEAQFHLPLSDQAFQEYLQFQQLIQQVQVSENSKDS